MDIEKLVDEITQAVMLKLKDQDINCNLESIKPNCQAGSGRRIDLRMKQFVHKNTLAAYDLKAGDIVCVSSRTKLTPMTAEHLKDIGIIIEVS